MSGEMLILTALVIPLLTAVGIAVFGKIPDIREGVTILGASALFLVSCLIAAQVAAGNPPELMIGDAAPRPHIRI